MPLVHSLFEFALASIVLLAIPGPAVIYILNRSVVDGRRVGLAAVCGLGIGNFMNVIASTAGLSAVLATSATAFSIIKWLGAGYLIYVGIHTFIRKPSGLGASSDFSATAPMHSSQAVYATPCYADAHFPSFSDMYQESCSLRLE